MHEAKRLVDEGSYPGQHLWGRQALEAAGLTVSMSDGTSGPRLLRGLGAKLGDIQQQRQAISSHADVLLAGDVTSLRLLTLLNWPRPKVAIVHPDAPRGRVAQLTTRRYDHVICLSRRVHNDLVSRCGRSAETTTLLPWGPDLSFSGYQSTGADLVVSTGKTGRDPGVLIEAMRGQGIPSWVYSAMPADMCADPDVEVRTSRAPFATFLSVLQRAALVVIPLSDPDRILGLTELNDALALGKPVVMTRGAFTDEIDIEQAGFGRWCSPGDPAQLRSVVRELIADEPLRAEMGRRARAFAETEWNYELFGDGLVQVVQSLVANRDQR